MMSKIEKDDIEEYVKITEEDDDRMVKIKNNIRKLKPVELQIFMTYVHLGTYAATAREYNVSAPTIKTYINKIKEKIV